MTAAKLLRAVMVAVAVLLISLASTAMATAAPSIPGIPDCKDAPAAQRPDQGVAGLLDGAPDPLPAPADPFVSTSTSIYDQYGYAGLRWNTHDLGCGGAIRDPEASADTMIGNLFLSGAVALTALSNGLHNQVAHPENYMAPLDEVVDRVSGRLHAAIWSPWGAVALVGVVTLLLGYSLRGQLSTVVSAAVWAVLVLALLSGLAEYPSRAASFFDSAVTDTIGNLQAGSAGMSTAGGTERAQGALTVQTVLYQGWLRGQLGSSDSTSARLWGPQLFQAQAMSRSEAAQAANPDRASELTERKAEDWKRAADEISQKDPSTYAVLQGKSGGRLGAGVLTFVGTLFTVGFRSIADGFLVAGLVMVRLLVMFFPAAAVVGIMAPLSSVIRRLGNIGAASLINVVAFSAGSVFHTTAVSAVLSTAKGAGMTVMALLLCLVLTVAALVLMAPFMSMTRMLGGRSRLNVMGSLRRNAIRYAVSRKATGDGTQDAVEEQLRHTERESTQAKVADPQRSESYRRATPVWDVTSEGMAAGRPPSGGGVVRRPTATAARGRGGWVPDPPPRPEPRPARDMVLVGSVVSEPQTLAQVHVLRRHDGNTEVRRDGSIGYEVFEPDRDRLGLDKDEREAS